MNLSNALVTAGHRVVLWSAAFHHLEKRHRSRDPVAHRVNETLEIRLIPSRGYKTNIGIDRLIDHAQLARNLRKMVEAETILPDVAFIGYPPIETAAFLAPWLAKRGVPVLLDVKDQWPELFLEAFPKRLKRFGRLLIFPYIALAKRAMRAATGFSSMANGYIEWATAYAGRRRNSYDGVFPLTSPETRINQDHLKAARLWCHANGFGQNDFLRILFVGTFNSVFDFQPVYDAANICYRHHLPVQFILCGDGTFIKAVREMMGKLPNVHFPGWVDRPKIEALAELSHAMIAPYMNIENFIRNIPNKIIDSLALGQPILCPLDGEVAHLISKYDVGMRYGGETGISLYECIQTLIEHPERREQMSRNARRLYLEKYTYEKVYGEMVVHLEKMAFEGKGKRHIPTPRC